MPLTQNQTQKSSTELFREIITKIAKFNGSQTPYRSFSVEPTMHQKLIDDLKSEHDFLRRINFIKVPAKKAQKVFLNATGSITSRTSLTRTPKSVIDSSARQYETAKRHFDPLILWELIDQWRHVGNLKNLHREMYTKLMGNEMAYIALRGTDRLSEPTNLEEVDKGFLTLLREEEPENVYSEHVVGTGVVILGKKRTVPLDSVVAVNVGGGVVGLPCSKHGLVVGGKVTIQGSSHYDGTYSLLPTSGDDVIHITATHNADPIPSTATATQKPDFANLDEFVAHGKDSIREDARDNLEVLLASNVLAAEEQKLYAGQLAETPSEHSKVQQVLKSFAALNAHRVIGMPSDTLFITSFKNLSIYELSGSHLRKWEEKHEMEGFVDWNRWEATNVVENPKEMFAIENIKFLRAYESE